MKRLIAVIAGFVVVVAGVAPAQASAQFAFRWAQCSQTAGSPQGAFECDVAWTGATNPVTADFSYRSNASNFTIDVFSTDSLTGSGYCSVYNQGGAELTVTLTDADGDSISQDIGSTCSPVVP